MFVRQCAHHRVFWHADAVQSFDVTPVFGDCENVLIAGEEQHRPLGKISTQPYKALN